MATQIRLLTAEEYAKLPDSGRPTELIRGEVVEMNPPQSRHGQVCGNAYFVLRSFLQGRELGHLLCNDSGVITERDPDTVRGADIAFYSYDKVPQGRLSGYLPVPPNVVFEILSPEDRPGRVAAKVQEYLNAGVDTVVVLDPEEDAAYVYQAGRPALELAADDTLTLPAVSPDFAARVGAFFD